MGVAELMIVLFCFGLAGLHIWGIVDVARRPDHQWKAIGQEKTLWLLVVLLAGLPGTIAYLGITRPKFNRMPALAAAPGWYPDPWARGYLRYFDGVQWTPQVTAALQPAPPHPIPPGAPR